MLERDYLMRQIMQLIQALQKIIRLRKKGEFKEALEEVNDFYTCLKIEQEVGSLSIEELVHLLVEEKKLTNDHIEMVASVLKEQGEMAGDESSRLGFFSKSLILLEKVERESVNFSMERLMKIGEMKEYLGEGKS